MLQLLIVDGQGGGIGRQLVEAVKAAKIPCCITVVGANATATAAMLKAGAHFAATGENPVVVACRKADVILGPVGIVIADSLWGEVTGKMALAVGRASAVKILIPMNRCENLVAGVTTLNATALIEDAITKLKEVILQKGLD
jgi:hypothetical protein